MTLLHGVQLKADSEVDLPVQVCLQRAQELLLGIEALVPIVKALQCSHLRASHWERLQGLVGGLPVGPESDVTLLQLTGVHVSSPPSPWKLGLTPGSAANRLCCACMYMHGCYRTHSCASMLVVAGVLHMQQGGLQ